MKNDCILHMISASGIIFLYIFACSFIPAFAEMPASILLFSDTYQGVLIDNETFVCQDTTDPFTLTGEWEGEAYPKGKVVIVFESGRKIETTYSKNGLIHGKVTEYLPDGTYLSYRCNRGHPYGLITKYNSDGSILGYDWFYQTRRVSTLKEISREVDYQELFTDSSDMLIPMKISGRVAALLDTNKQQNIILRSMEGKYYVLTYFNTDSTTYKINQAFCPNFRIGDRIVAYRFFQRCSSLGDLVGCCESCMIDEWAEENPGSQDTDAVMPALEEVVSVESGNTDEPENAAEPMHEGDLVQDSEDDMLSGNEKNGENQTLQDEEFYFENSLAVTVPYFLLCCADYMEQRENSLTAAKTSIDNVDYEDVLRNPYLYGGTSITVKGKVTQTVIDYKDQEIVFNIVSEVGDTFVGIYSFKTDDLLPAMGDRITVDAKCAGNYKRLLSNSKNESENDADNYVIFPYLIVSEIVF